MKTSIKLLFTSACVALIPSLSQAQVGDADLRKDREALAADIEQIDKENKHVHIYYVLGNSPLYRMHPKRMEYVNDLLGKRVAQMDRALNGETLTIPAPVSELPGPPGSAKRYKHPRGPKAAMFPHKMLKKTCSAREFEKAGFDQGVRGNDFKGAYKRDKKVCGSALKKNREQYEAGYATGIAAHCGYERGFLIGRGDSPTYALCDDKGFETYDIGKQHAAARKPYMDAYWAIADQYDFTSYTSDRITIVARIKAGDRKNAVYREARKARFKREYTRLKATGFQDFAATYPWIKSGPRNHGEVVEDSKLEYSIPR